MDENRRDRIPRSGWKRRYRILLTAGVCAGLGVSILAFLLIRRAEGFRIRAEFNEAAAGHASAIERSIERKLVVLESLRAFLRSRSRPDREQFRTFAEALLARVRGIEALGWAPRVRGADRAGFEAAARRDGLPGYRITERNAEGRIVPASRRKEYLPILRVEPHRGNESALGYDQASDPMRRESLYRARDSGRAAATAAVLPGQEPGGRGGLLVYLPLYGRAGPFDTVEARREHFAGTVVGAFRVSEIMKDGLQHLQPGDIDVHVFDKSDSGAGGLLYHHASRPGRGARAGDHAHTEAELLAGTHHTNVIEVAGRRWSIVCAPGPTFVRARRTWYPWAGLGGGVLITGLLSAYLVKARKAASRDELHAAQLLNTNRRLERQIDQRRRAEEEIRDLARFPSEDPHPVMRIAGEGIVLYANGPARPILAARNCRVGQAVPDDWRELGARALGTGELQETEVEHGGRVFSFQVAPIAETGYVNWYGRDVTERKNAQEAAQRAHQEVLEEQRHARRRAEAELARISDELVRTTQLAAIGQLSASIAHDLRNPLGSARNAVYYLKRRVVADHPEITEYLDIIDQEIDTSDRIIGSLLAVARTKEPVRQQVDLGRLVEEVFEKGRAPGVRCRLVLDPDPFVLEADPDQLRQVLRNLLANAVQAMQDGGEFLVEARREPGCDTIVLRDTGPGVSAEIRKSLFEPLVTAKAKGIGLGLTICRQIVERHNGSIELMNNGGGGAAFRIRLPRHEPQGPEDRRPRPCPSRPPPPEPKAC